jgi:hypothetical protein
MRIPARISCIVLGLCVVFLAFGCSNDDDEGPPGVGVNVEELLETSQHGTTRGMEYWYEEEQGGFESLTGVPYSQLGCFGCHVEPSECTTCHEETKAFVDTPTDDKCLACHGRQGAEMNHGFTDVHRDAGMMCADCHGANTVHGDGEPENSMLVGNTIEVRCTDSGCHENVPGNTFHGVHGDNMECAACHTQSVVNCYNCHFESEVAGVGKIAFGQFKNWRLLLLRDREDGSDPKIDVGNFMTLTYEGKAFVAMAPFYAHTISKNAIEDCDDCHNNEYVEEYEQTGQIVMSTWNEADSTLAPSIKGKGIIPVPPDWETSLIFEFATLDPDNPDNPGGRKWIRVEPTEVGHQMLFAEPLEGLPD